MRTIRFAGLMLASTGVLAIAACGRSGPAAPASTTPPASTLPPAESSYPPEEAPAAGPAPTPVPAAEATAPAAPPPPPAATQAAPDVADAASFDSDIRSGGVNAWRYNQGGESFEAWQAPSRGLRIVRGGRIFYYRPGATDPYLVRDNGVFFIFRNGRPERALDARGRRLELKAENREQRASQLLADARRLRRMAGEPGRGPAVNPRPGRPGPTMPPPAAADADEWRAINARQADIKQRIDQGAKSGALTAKETRQLRAEFQAITQQEARDRKSGVGLTAAERADLNRRLDDLSRRVGAQKHDTQKRR